MNRKFLEEQGLEKEVIDAIMAEHGRTVNSLNTRVTELEETESDLQGQIKDRDDDLKKLQDDNKDNGDLEAQIAKLQGDYETLESESAERLVGVQRKHALDKAILEAKPKDAVPVMALLDQDKVVYKDGELSGVNEQIDALKESHPYLFDLGTKSKGHEPKGGKSHVMPNVLSEAMKQENFNMTEFLKRKQKGE